MRWEILRNGPITTAWHGYSYNNLNWLTTITYPSRTLSYAYDPLGNLTRATNENGSIYMSYDNRYRLKHRHAIRFTTESVTTTTRPAIAPSCH